MAGKTAIEGLLQHAFRAETRQEYDKATKYYEASLAISEVVHGSENPRLFPLLFRLISLYERVQDFSSMIRLLDQAKRIATNPKKSSHFVEIPSVDYDTQNITPLCMQMVACD